MLAVLAVFFQQILSQRPDGSANTGDHKRREDGKTAKLVSAPDPFLLFLGERGIVLGLTLYLR